ncbi:MAG: hypothetical protein ABI333_19570, partial [bacterium]
LATLDGEGLPHLSLITTLRAKSPEQLLWGQFCEGRSKSNVREHPQVGFLCMTMKREIWRGRARWTHASQQGTDYELLNQSPMFRYNAYFGIHTVHYMDVEAVSDREGLPLPGVAAGLLSTAITRIAARSGLGPPILTPWATRLLARPDTLKFLAYVREDGFPEIVPALPCLAADSRRLVFAPTVYRPLLTSFTRGATVAVFGLNLSMESVLVRGTFAGYGGLRRLGTGIIDINWVYNSMPPKFGVVYPAQPLDPVTHF